MYLTDQDGKALKNSGHSSEQEALTIYFEIRES